MHPRMILAIVGKDLRETIRDGRILLAIVLPLVIGVSYNLLFDEEPVETTPTAAAAYAASGPTRLPDLLRAATGGGVELELTPAADPETVRRLVADDAVDLGLVLPSGFDAAVANGETPPLEVLTPAAPDFATDFLRAALDQALRQLAGQPPPATIAVSAVAAPAGDDGGSGFIFDRVGLAPYFVVTNAIFVVIMVALFAVPVMLTEEGEKRTLDALTAIASYADVIAAKAVVGLVFAAAAASLLLALTRLAVADPLAFGATLLLLAVSLIGFGLLLGGLFRSVTQLNTWSSLILLPVVAPIFAVGFPLPRAVDLLLSALPTSQATRLALDALVGEPLFGGAWLGAGVIAAWGALAYGLLLWRLARRDG